MGLTVGSTGHNAAEKELIENSAGERVIALAGNPNVGKSTVFNALTGLKQHTGNWTGKTVSNASGRFEYDGNRYILVDIPGTYSLMAHSEEEEVARDFICFGGADGVIIVCDATCLERNLNLVLQTIEITPDVIVCVNLIDEAKKKHIAVDTDKLSKILGVPVCAAAARSGTGLDILSQMLAEIKNPHPENVYKVEYPDEISQAAEKVAGVLELDGAVPEIWAALRLIDGDEKLEKGISEAAGKDISASEAVSEAVRAAREGLDMTQYRDGIINSVVKSAERIAGECVTFEKTDYYERDRRIDNILTHRIWGVPIMAALLALVFWITISGANYPSAMLSELFGGLGVKLGNALSGAPVWLRGVIVDGIYRVLTWVIAVMLPPMAIFFPLFTLLEDLGYLPRVAFNLDKYFKKANACGKQSLTMAMGFGCNAAGITGCRIIDSPRERLIAIITNNFVPCNGRFPTLIAIISMFFAVGSNSLAVLILTGIIILGVILTFKISELLSKTILKGVPSSFTLELPPYRCPQLGKVLVRSMLDRTIFVLGRAVAVAAPAGLFIWLMANINVGGNSLLSLCSGFLDPFARVFGLDGVILLAFILGFPANEIVVPIMLMCYLSTGSLVEYDSLSSLKEILTANGWTPITAICMLIFTLCHYPCSTALMTVKKETQSVKWTLAAFAVPTITGFVLCFAVSSIAKLITLIAS